MSDVKNTRLKFVARDGAEKYEKFRVCQWINVDTMLFEFGVEAQVSKLVWCHIAHHGTPLIFKDKNGAKDEVCRLRDASKRMRSAA